MKALIPSLVLVVALLSAVQARSADTAKTPQEIENSAKELVRKLGSPNFREREAASRELAKLGIGALKAIEEGLKNPQPEIVTRCEALSSTIRALDLKRRIEELAADKEGRIANTLPLGATYEKICGKDENARKFYIELCKTHFKMLDDAATDPKTTGQAYFDLSDQIVNRSARTFSMTEFAVMLLIGADEKIGPIINLDQANGKQLNRGDYQPLTTVFLGQRFREAVVDANNGRYFRKLLFAWVKERTDPNAMYITLSLMQKIAKTEAAKLQSDPDTLEFVVDAALSTPANKQHDKGAAMMVMAGIVKVDHIPYIAGKFFKDETRLDTQFQLVGEKDVPVEVRVCDFALAICVKLSGLSFKDYGFDILMERGKLDAYQFAGFAKDETRKAAFKKYEEWRKANPITKDEPKKDKSK